MVFKVGVGAFLSPYAQGYFSNVVLPAYPTWMLHRSFPQPWETPQATACPTVTLWFVQLHPSAAYTEVWLRSSNGPAATKSLLEQATYHQLRPRQALLSTEHCPIRYLLPFNYNMAEILFIALHFKNIRRNSKHFLSRSCWYMCVCVKVCIHIHPFATVLHDKTLSNG